MELSNIVTTVSNTFLLSLVGSYTLSNFLTYTMLKGTDWESQRNRENNEFIDKLNKTQEQIIPQLFISDYFREFDKEDLKLSIEHCNLSWICQGNKHSNLFGFGINTRYGHFGFDYGSRIFYDRNF